MSGDRGGGPGAPGSPPADDGGAPGDAARGTPSAAGARFGDPIDGVPILHEDARLIVVDKPAGLLSQPGKRESDSVVERVRAARPSARGPLMMHRLDMDTSGVLVLAKDAEAHRALSAQFERREVGKRYRARLERPPPGLGGRIALPLRLDPERRPLQVVCLSAGRPSTTLWRVGAGVADSRDGSRAAPRGANGVALDDPGRRPVDVVLHPLSGRTHQLRVHAADPRGLDAPIVGDRLYGRAGARLMLHAERLAVRHPDDARWLIWRSEVPF